MILNTRGVRLRALGYHGTPRSARDSLARQLDYLSKAYEPIDEAGLERLFSGGPAGPKTALLLSFDDGLLSNFEVAAPLLEERGMRGFFFVPTGLLDSRDPKGFCSSHGINLLPGEVRGMNWEELRELKAKGHAIGCHTTNHVRMSGPAAPDLLAAEIPAAKARLEQGLASPVWSFAWVGGEPDTYDPGAMRAIQDAGFRYVFTTQSKILRRGGDSLMIHRTILDADMGYALFRAKLGGFSDIVHGCRRHVVEASLGLESMPPNQLPDGDQE